VRLPAFADRLVGQADDGKGDHAARYLNLNIDIQDLDTLERHRIDPRNQTPNLLYKSARECMLIASVALRTRRRACANALRAVFSGERRFFLKSRERKRSSGSLVVASRRSQLVTTGTNYY